VDQRSSEERLGGALVGLLRRLDEADTTPGDQTPSDVLATYRLVKREFGHVVLRAVPAPEPLSQVREDLVSNETIRSLTATCAAMTSCLTAARTYIVAVAAEYNRDGQTSKYDHAKAYVERIDEAVGNPMATAVSTVVYRAFGFVRNKRAAAATGVRTEYKAPAGNGASSLAMTSLMAAEDALLVAVNVAAGADKLPSRHMSEISKKDWAITRLHEMYMSAARDDYVGPRTDADALLVAMEAMRVVGAARAE
jgi:hypothetical protein